MPFTTKNTSGSNNVNWKGGRPKLNCAICGKEFLGYLHRESKFCSPKCCGVTKIGKTTWMKGKKLPEFLCNENNKGWKGDKASLTAIHNWVVRRKGTPETCEICGKSPQPAKGGRRRIHWANINHSYKRILSDYIALCIPCHREFDGFSEQQLRKMSLAKIGKPSWNKGIKRWWNSPTEFKKGTPPPKHKPSCNCFRCHKKLVANPVSH